MRGLEKGLAEGLAKELPEGLVEMLAEDMQFGQMQLFEQYLNTPPTGAEELAKSGLEQLEARLADLRRLHREQTG